MLGTFMPISTWETNQGTKTGSTIKEICVELYLVKIYSSNHINCWKLREVCTTTFVLSAFLDYPLIQVM